jgi:choline dehydrogenase-like flavoprotein
VWEDYIIAPTENLQNISADALEQHIRNTVVSTSHFAGSCNMSARDAWYGIVNLDLLVKGVHGLRIIDNSVLVSKSLVPFICLTMRPTNKPIVPSANTQSAAYVVAKRGSAMVKQMWT